MDLGEIAKAAPKGQLQKTLRQKNWVQMVLRKVPENGTPTKQSRLAGESFR